MRGADPEERLFREHERTQVQALVLTRGNPRAVDGDELLQRLQEVRHRQLGKGESSRRALQAATVLVGAEGMHRAVGVAISLDALEDLLAVVQDRGGRVE